MEKKKILWVVVLICVFALIVFGAVVILYMPSRSTGQDLRQSVAMTPATRTDGTNAQSGIDPDSWVRDGGNTPGLDTTLQPTNGNINLTIVNNDTTAANFGTLDVSGLTSSQTAIAGTTGLLPLSEIPGQSAAVAGTESTSAQSTGAQSTGTAAVTDSNASTQIKSQASAQATQTSEKAVAKASVKTTTKAPTEKQAQVAKPAEKKPVIVTEYWIQTGSFASKINAEKARTTLTARFLSAEIFTKEVTGSTTYRVRVGPYKSKTEADYWLGTIKEIPSFEGSYVSEVKTKK